MPESDVRGGIAPISVLICINSYFTNKLLSINLKNLRLTCVQLIVLGCVLIYLMIIPGIIFR